MNDDKLTIRPSSNLFILYPTKHKLNGDLKFLN